MFSILFLLEVLFLLIGFVLLIKGADFFVDGSSAIAKIFNIPSVVVGLTIVAIGTSLPEMAVSISASIQGSNAIAISNVIGSNLFNLVVVLGISSIIRNVVVNKSLLKFEFPFSIITTAVLFVFCADAILFGGVIGKINFLNQELGAETVGRIGRLEGVVLLLCFAFFIYQSVRKALAGRNEAAPDDNEKTMGLGKSLIYILIGIIAIAFGGDLVVDNAKSIALVLGMSDTLVGLTVVALGTSLPELVTSIVAGVKGENDIAVGNVVGSNLSNILLVTGMAAVISPIEITLFTVIDIVILFVVSIVVYIMACTKKTINKPEGIVMVLIYAAYMWYIIVR